MPRATTGIAYGVFGIVLLGGLVFTVFVTVPAWAGVRAARTALADAQRDLGRRETFLRDVDARAAELTTYDRDARVLAVMFPETTGAADFAAVLHGAAAASGVTLDQVSGVQLQKKVSQAPAEADTPEALARRGPRGAPAASPTPPPAASALPVYEATLRGKGSYAQVRAFLRALERSVRLFDIARVELRAGRETPEAASAVTFQVTIHFIRVESAS